MKKITTLIIILSLFAISSFATNSTKLMSTFLNCTAADVKANEVRFNVSDVKKDNQDPNPFMNRNDIINRSSDQKRGSFEITPGQILSSSDGV